jgi:SWI/SNF-related matrix-associated actin-dependent regulator 1 of chromatin subfamily A
VVQIELAENTLRVTHTPFSQKVVDKLKQVGGGRYYASDPRHSRHWRFPYYQLSRLLESFPDAWLGDSLAQRVELERRAEQVKLLPDAPAPERFGLELTRQQRVAVHFISSLDRAILNTGVGSGKTRMALAWAMRRLHAGDRCGVLVVTKSAGKYDYLSHILRAMPGSKVALIEGQRGHFPRPGEVEWVVLNYDLLSFRLEQIKAFRFASVIFSEAHKLKSGDRALRGQAGYEIAADVPNVLMETASLTPNRNAELFPLLVMLGALDRREDYFSYHRHFCDGQQITVGRFPARKVWDFTGSSNSEQLHEFIAPFTFSRSKEEMLEGLPPVRFETILVDLENASEYNHAAEEFLEWLHEREGELAVERAVRAQAIVRLGKLFQLAALGKMRAIADIVDTYTEAGEKLVVFSSYKEPLRKLAESFEPDGRWKGRSVPYVFLTGDQSAKEKAEVVERFQNDPRVMLCLATTEAGGESVTLTSAHAALFISLPWSPETWAQAWGRIHRATQTQPCQVVMPLARQTVEIEKVETLYAKALTISQVMTGGDRSANSEALKQVLRLTSNEEEFALV